MSETRTAVVIGVGAARGLGGALCRRFAAAGLHVFAAGRTEAKLEAVIAEVRAVGGSGEAAVCDTTDPAAVAALIARAEAVGPMAVAVYNAGNNAPAKFLDTTPEAIEQLWRVGCFGGFIFAQAALKAMVPRGEGALFFTGASASLRGRPNFAGFAMAKAGLRMLAQALAREFGPQGVHVAHVIVDGVLDGDRIRESLPEFAAAKGEDGLIDLEASAALYEMLWRQPRAAWTHELDVRPFKESF